MQEEGLTKQDLIATIESLIDEYYEMKDPDFFCQEINRIYQVYCSFGLNEKLSKIDLDIAYNNSIKGKTRN